MENRSASCMELATRRCYLTPDEFLLFMRVTMQDVKDGQVSDGGFRGSCMECGEAGHKAVECPKREYKEGNKRCVPPMRLFEATPPLVDARGVALR